MRSERMKAMAVMLLLLPGSLVFLGLLFSLVYAVLLFAGLVLLLVVPFLLVWAFTILLFSTARMVISRDSGLRRALREALKTR